MRELARDEERLVLGLMLTPGIGNSTMHKVLARLADDDDGFDALGGPDSKAMAQGLDLPVGLAEQFIDSRAESAPVFDDLKARGMRLLIFGTPSYPARLAQTLGRKCPAVLFAAGNVTVLELPAVGFCGSRNPSEQGLTIARQASAALANEGVNIVAGYAKGIDLEAHYGALDAGGATTMVLAEGILKFQMKQRLGEVVSADNTLVISELPPGLPWNGRNAMIRNQTICGLVSAMVMVESGTTGGTFEAGKFAQTIGCPLFVIEYDDPPESAAGNRYFIERGAVAIRDDGDASPDVGGILKTVRDSERRTVGSKAGQGDLFGGGR